MTQKVYLICIRKNGDSIYYPFEGFDSFEKAKKHLFDTQKKIDNRRILETSTKNEFVITDDNGNYIQTLVIEDIWVR